MCAVFLLCGYVTELHALWNVVPGTLEEGTDLAKWESGLFQKHKEEVQI